MRAVWLVFVVVVGLAQSYASPHRHPHDLIHDTHRLIDESHKANQARQDEHKREALLADYVCGSSPCSGADCKCASMDVPGGFTREKTPMFVLVTWDDAVADGTKEALDDVSNGVASANGCPVKHTMYVSTEWTNFNQVHELWARGDEVACHTITHSTAYESTQDTWQNEVAGCKATLATLGNIPEDDITGFRSPFLQYSKFQLEALRDKGFTYDSSIREYGQQGATWGSMISVHPDKIWPYTFDYGVGQHCDWVHGNCQHWRIPGLWEVPMWSHDNAAGAQQGLMDFYDVDKLKQSFLNAYNGNRHPMGVWLHAAFTGSTSRAQINEFLKFAAGYNDVYFVTNQQLISWMRNPVDTDSVAATLGCSSSRTPDCTTTATCELDGHRFTMCGTTCPTGFPMPDTWDTILCGLPQACVGGSCMCQPSPSPSPSSTPGVSGSESVTPSQSTTASASAGSESPSASDSGLCSGCSFGTTGPCKQASTGVCYAFNEGTDTCPAGAERCNIPASVSPSTSFTSTPTPTPSQTASNSGTPSPTVSDTPSQSAPVSETPTPSPSVSISASPSATISDSATPSPSGSRTSAPSITSTPSRSVSASPTASVSETPTLSISSSPTASMSSSPSSSTTPSSTLTPTPSPSRTDGVLCWSCATGTSGVCIGADSVCWGFVPGTTTCWANTYKCSTDASIEHIRASLELPGTTLADFANSANRNSFINIVSSETLVDADKVIINEVDDGPSSSNVAASAGGTSLGRRRLGDGGRRLGGHRPGKRELGAHNNGEHRLGGHCLGKHELGAHNNGEHRLGDGGHRLGKRRLGDGEHNNGVRGLAVDSLYVLLTLRTAGVQNLESVRARFESSISTGTLGSRLASAGVVPSGSASNVQLVGSMAVVDPDSPSAQEQGTAVDSPSDSSSGLGIGWIIVIVVVIIALLFVAVQIWKWCDNRRSAKAVAKLDTESDEASETSPGVTPASPKSLHAKRSEKSLSSDGHKAKRNKVEPLRTGTDPAASSSAWNSKTGTPRDRAKLSPTSPHDDADYDADAALSKMVSTPPMRKPMLSPLQGRDHSGPAFGSTSLTRGGAATDSPPHSSLGKTHSFRDASPARSGSKRALLTPKNRQLFTTGSLTSMGGHMNYTPSS